MNSTSILVYSFVNIFFVVFYLFYSVNNKDSACNKYVNIYLFLNFLVNLSTIFKYNLRSEKYFYKYFIINMCIKLIIYIYYVCFIIVIKTFIDLTLLCLYFNKITENCLNITSSSNRNSINRVDIESDEEYTEIIKNVVEIDDVNDEYDNICVICMEELECIKYKLEDNCNHVFHKDCIDKWLEVKNICPLCMK